MSVGKYPAKDSLKHAVFLRKGYLQERTAYWRLKNKHTLETEQCGRWYITFVRKANQQKRMVRSSHFSEWVWKPDCITFWKVSPTWHQGALHLPVLTFLQLLGRQSVFTTAIASALSLKIRLLSLVLCISNRLCASISDLCCIFEISPISIYLP